MEWGSDEGSNPTLSTNGAATGQRSIKQPFITSDREQMRVTIQIQPSIHRSRRTEPITMVASTRPSSTDQPHLHRPFLPSGQQPSVNPSTLMASMRSISPHPGVLSAFINPSSPARNQPPQIAPKSDSRPIQHPSAALPKIPNPRQANGSRSSIEFGQEAKQQHERPRLHLKHPFAAPDSAP